MSTLRELSAAIDARRDELLAKPYPHGSCECTDCPSCKRVPGPAAFTVVRGGTEMKVCTRCDLTSDRATQKLLVGPDEDLEVYEAWDDMGAFCIDGMRKKHIDLPAQSESKETP